MSPSNIGASGPCFNQPKNGISVVPIEAQMICHRMSLDALTIQRIASSLPIWHVDPCYSEYGMNYSKRNHLTPFALAGAMASPFIWFLGGVSLTLALAAVSLGLDPAQLVGSFLTDATVALGSLVWKLVGIWVAYTTFYFLITWPYRPLLNPFTELPPPHRALYSFVRRWINPEDRAGMSALSRLLSSLNRHSTWLGLGFSWAQGAHPQIE